MMISDHSLAIRVHRRTRVLPAGVRLVICEATPWGARAVQRVANNGLANAVFGVMRLV